MKTSLDNFINRVITATRPSTLQIMGDAIEGGQGGMEFLVSFIAAPLAAIERDLRGSASTSTVSLVEANQIKDSFEQLSDQDKPAALEFASKFFSAKLSRAVRNPIQETDVQLEIEFAPGAEGVLLDTFGMNKVKKQVGPVIWDAWEVKNTVR